MDADVAAMIRLKNGDDHALNEIMDRWKKPITMFIYRSIGDQEEAIDLAQQAFVKLYEAKARFKPSGKLSSYLFTIAVNLCRNHKRWLARHPTVSMDCKEINESKSIAEPTDASGMPSENAIQNETAMAIQKAIQSLPEDLKESLILFEYENMSYQDIAQIMGCTAKAVETRIYRARSVLREKLSTTLST